METAVRSLVKHIKTPYLDSVSIAFENDGENLEAVDSALEILAALKDSGVVRDIGVINLLAPQLSQLKNIPNFAIASPRIPKADAQELLEFSQAFNVRLVADGSESCTAFTSCDGNLERTHWICRFIVVHNCRTVLEHAGFMYLPAC